MGSSKQARSPLNLVQKLLLGSVEYFHILWFLRVQETNNLTSNLASTTIPDIITISE